MNVACGILINLHSLSSVCESGHRAPTCPLSGLCRRCRQPGHVAKECTQAWDPSVSAPAPAPGTNMPSGPSASFDHAMADAFPMAPDCLFLFSTSFSGHFSASSQRRKALGARLVCSAPVSVAAPVPASVDATPTTVPAAAPLPIPAAPQVPALPSTNIAPARVDPTPFLQFSGDPETVARKLRGYVRKIVANQVKRVTVATLRTWTQHNFNHCSDWIAENFSIPKRFGLYTGELIWHLVKEAR